MPLNLDRVFWDDTERFSADMDPLFMREAMKGDSWIQLGCSLRTVTLLVMEAAVENCPVIEVQ